VSERSGVVPGALGCDLLAEVLGEEDRGDVLGGLRKHDCRGALVDRQVPRLSRFVKSRVFGKPVITMLWTCPVALGPVMWESRRLWCRGEDGP
jgi:hypothetical protein